MIKNYDDKSDFVKKNYDYSNCIKQDIIRRNTKKHTLNKINNNKYNNDIDFIHDNNDLNNDILQLSTDSEIDDYSDTDDD